EKNLHRPIGKQGAPYLDQGTRATFGIRKPQGSMERHAARKILRAALPSDQIHRGGCRLLPANARQPFQKTLRFHPDQLKLEEFLEFKQISTFRGLAAEINNNK